MSLLVPTTPSPKKRLPGESLTSHESILRKEHELNAAEKETLNSQKEQLNAEANVLRKQKGVLSKNLKQEQNRLNSLIADEEERNKAILEKIQKDFDYEIDCRNQQKKAVMTDAKSKLQSIFTAQQTLISCVKENHQSICDFIKNSQLKLNEIVNN